MALLLGMSLCVIVFFLYDISWKHHRVEHPILSQADCLGVSRTHPLCWNNPVQYPIGRCQTNERSDTRRDRECLPRCQYPGIHKVSAWVSVWNALGLDDPTDSTVPVGLRLKWVGKGLSCQVVKNVSGHGSCMRYKTHVRCLVQSVLPLLVPSSGIPRCYSSMR